jgi:hypothetical protein
MNATPNQRTPKEMRGLAVSSDVLHVSHFIDEFCDVLSARTSKESVVVLQPTFVRNFPRTWVRGNSSYSLEVSEMDEFDDHWDSVVADMVSDWLPEGGHEPF